MMQSCASAAKLRGGGPNLHSGLEAVVFTTGHRHLGSSSAGLTSAAKLVIPVAPQLPLILMPVVTRRPAAPLLW